MILISSFSFFPFILLFYSFNLTLLYTERAKSFQMILKIYYSSSRLCKVILFLFFSFLSVWETASPTSKITLLIISLKGLKKSNKTFKNYLGTFGLLYIYIYISSCLPVFLVSRFVPLVVLFPMTTTTVRFDGAIRRSKVG